MSSAFQNTSLIPDKVWCVCDVAQATSKRFLQAIEPLLMPEKDKHILRQDGYDRLRDTVAHLNYTYGDLKGSEGLRDLWNKIKLKEEPEEVSLLRVEV